MRHYTIASCFVLVFATALSAVADDAPSAKKKSFRFLLQPNESKDRLLAVPASEDDEPSKDGTIVTCARLRFEKNAIVFIDVTIESEHQRITAAKVTVQLDKVSGPDVSWNLSDDFKMTFKTAEAKQRFLEEHALVGQPDSDKDLEP